MESKWISIVVAALAAVVLGYVWNNKIFENLAQKPDEHRMPTPMYLPIAFIMNAIIAFGLHGQVIGLHNFINSLMDSGGEISEHPFFHGAFHGSYISLVYGVISVIVLTSLINGKGFRFIAITVGYWVLALALMGGIVGAIG